MLVCDSENLKEKINFFKKFGATAGGGITRLALSKEDLAARDAVCARCQKIGMTILIDDMANIYATLAGSEDLPAIMFGSHLDSVINGGNYDGVLGVLAALEVIETIYKNKYVPPHPLKLVVWTNEEGSRFDPAMMSSGVLTGEFVKEAMLKIEDSDETTFETALKKSNYLGEIRNRFDPAQTQAYLELHIEQGPVLEAEEKEIGIVAGVAGMVNYEITLNGQSDHAGTTPMKFRQDALLAAARTIILLHEKLDRLEDELVYTTGRLNVWPNVHTVIPAKVAFTLDCRHKDSQVLQQVAAAIYSLPESIEKCRLSYKELWKRETVKFDASLVDKIKENSDKLGLSSKKIYSGAGHDAQYISKVVPTGMIFLPSKNGHSHCEEEYTSLHDCVNGTNVLLETVLELDKSS